MLNGSNVFSVIDLKSGYNQIPMHPKDIAKTAVVTSFGSYKMELYAYWFDVLFNMLCMKCPIICPIYLSTSTIL